MSTSLVTLFQQPNALNLPAYLKAGGDTATSALAGGLAGGRNRIGFKGARFRLIRSGAEVAVKDENQLDVVIVTANPSVSRIYYKEKYKSDVKVAPACFSPDGITPDASVAQPQAAKCAACPQNQKGSAITDDGKKSRACAFSKRLVVKLHGDPENVLYQADLKAMSIFGDGKPSQGLYTLSEYSKLLQLKGVRAEGIVTRLSFDTDSSVPKLYFTPVGFLQEADFRAVLKLAESDEAKLLATVDAVTTDLSEETDGGFETPKAAPVQATPVAAAPVQPAPVVPQAAAPAVPLATTAPAGATLVADDADLAKALAGLMM